MQQGCIRKVSGFTLIEVIIAMAIFAIVASLAYSGLQSIIYSKTRTEATLNRLQQLQMTMLTLTTDFQQLSNRNGHDALGGRLLKLSTLDPDHIVDFTRNGWRNPANQVRSTLQRVAYKLDEDKLVRIYWPHVDRSDDDRRVERTLINNIEELKLRFLNQKNEWKNDWPSASAMASSNQADSPVAIEITLIMGDWGEIKRLIKVSLE